MIKYIKKILFFGFLIASSIAFDFWADPDPAVDPQAPTDDYIYALIV